MFNLAQALLDPRFDASVALRCYSGDHRFAVTYAQLHAQVNRMGHALLARGIRREQRVALLLRDNLAFALSFLGALKIGAIPVPLNPLEEPETLRFELQDMLASMLVATVPYANRIGALEDSSPWPVLLDVPDGDSESIFTATAYASSVLDFADTRPDDPCYWQYTSGTTGRPKAVMHLQADTPCAVGPVAEQVYGLRPTDCTLSGARMHTSYGLFNSLLLPLSYGASSVLCDLARLETDDLLRLVRTGEPTLLQASPTAYARLCSAFDAENAALGPDREYDQRIGLHSPMGNIRLACAGGEPLPEPVYRHFKEHCPGIELLDQMGSTEMGGPFSSNLPGNVRPGSSGVVLGTGSWEIHDLDDQGWGELWIKADSVAIGYWNRRLATKEAFVGEWLRTGDRYRADAEHFLWFGGRVVDTFKVNGQWLVPQEVESVLLEHPSIAEVAVVASLDEQGFTKPTAFCVLKPEAGAVAERSLQAWARTKLQPYKVPRQVIFVEALPHTPAGKLKRHQLQPGGDWRVY